MAVATEEIERIARHQLYVTVVVLSLVSITDITVIQAKNKEVVGAIFRLGWKNTRLTPARDVLLSIESVTLPVDETKTFTPKWAVGKPGDIAGPGVTTRHGDLRVGLGVFKRIESGEVKLLVHGAAQYRDVYGDTIRLSETCQRIDFEQQVGTDNIFSNKERFVAHLHLYNDGTQHTAT